MFCIVEIQAADGVIAAVKGADIWVTIVTNGCPCTETRAVAVESAVCLQYILVDHDICGQLTVGRSLTTLDKLRKGIEVIGCGNEIIAVRILAQRISRRFLLAGCAAGGGVKAADLTPFVTIALGALLHAEALGILRCHIQTAERRMPFGIVTFAGADHFRLGNLGGRFCGRLRCRIGFSFSGQRSCTLGTFIVALVGFCRGGISAGIVMAGMYTHFRAVLATDMAAGLTCHRLGIVTLRRMYLVVVAEVI